MPPFARGVYGLGFAVDDQPAAIWVLGLGFIGFAALASAPLLGIRQGLRERGVRVMSIVLLVLFAVAVGLVGWRGRGTNFDEMEHLHSAWLMSQGKLPYVDFWQHHSPALWLALAPALGAMAPSASAIDLARLVALALGACSALLVVLISRRLDGNRAAPYALALVLAAYVPAELCHLRPDLLADALCLAGVLVLMRPWGVGTSLGSGVLLGLAAACHLRTGFLLVALPVAALTDFRHFPRGLGLIAAHVAGIVVGVLPLWLWLHAHGLWELYLEWVVRFNGSMESRPGGTLPLVPVALAVAWAVRVRADRWASMGQRERLLLATLGLCVLQFLTVAGAKFIYYEQLILLLAAVAGASEARRLCDHLLAAGRPILIGALTGILLLPTVFGAVGGLGGEYGRAKRQMDALLTISGGEPVVAVPPGHPVFAPDATDLDQQWQFNHWLEKPEVRARLKGIDEQIIKARPSLVVEFTSGPVTPGYSQSQFVNRLVTAGVVTMTDGVRLEQFLRGNYNLLEIGHLRYWARRDRPVPPEAEVLRRAGLQSPDPPPVPVSR